MHLQPVFKQCRTRGGKVSEAAFERGLCLPSGSPLSDADQQRVVEVVRRVHRI
jgi:dTDP-4-amino-4,6-dideoxygalactose transaminase